MAEVSIIPSLRAAGKFVASVPYDRVVNPDVFYSVEAIRTIPEMQGLNINVYARVFKPIGLAETDAQAAITAAIAANAAVISLIPRSGPPVYVLSTYLTSFPLTDGYSYERMCIITDCGPLPPEYKDSLTQAMEHFNSYVKDHYGITVTSKLGTIPTIGYVSKDEHDDAERTRQNAITDNGNDLATIRDLMAKLENRDAYIRDLETRLGVVP